MLWSTSYLVFNELSERAASRQTNISIISHSNTETCYISIESINRQGGRRERDRARNDRLTEQKKNAACSRNEKKVPEGERQTYMATVRKTQKMNDRKWNVPAGKVRR